MVFLNLIPKQLWFLNLRKILTKQRWKSISDSIKEEFNYTCVCCNIDLKKLKMKKYFHAHEVWIFDDKNLTATLKAIICVCSYCHNVIHIGYSSIKGEYKKSLHHMMKVNNWTYEEANSYIEFSFEQWNQRSNKKWTLIIEDKNLLTFEELNKFNLLNKK